MVLVVALNTYKAIVQTSISFLHAKMYCNCVKHCNICCISNTVIVCKNNAFKEKKKQPSSAFGTLNTLLFQYHPSVKGCMKSPLIKYNLGPCFGMLMEGSNVVRGAHIRRSLFYSRTNNSGGDVMARRTFKAIRTSCRRRKEAASQSSSQPASQPLRPSFHKMVSL